MKRAAARVASARQPDRDRAGYLCAPEKCGGLIDDLIDGHRREIRELHFDNRAHSLDGGPDRASNHCVLADWSIQDPARKFFGQVFCRLKSTAEGPDILAINVHPLIVSESFFLRFPNRLEVRDSHRTKSASAIL